MQFKERVRTNVSIKFQTFFIIVGLGIFISLLLWRSSQFISHEKTPEILPITPATYKKLGGFARTIQTGLSINQFVNFDMVSNTFVFDGIIWFIFDPGAIAIDTLEKFSFLKGEILYKSPPNIKVVDEKLNVNYQIRVKFSTPLDYTDFPLDNHQIYIMLVNQFISPEEINFESFNRQFIITADVATTGWKLIDHSVQVGYFQSNLDPDDPRQSIASPGIIFILDYSRNSIRYALSILLPLALIAYLTFFSISLRLLSAISITAAGVTAILAYRFVIENLSPKTGFFMLSDYLFFLFLAVTVTTFIIHIAEETRFELSPFYKKIYLFIINFIIISFVLYLLLR